MASMGECATIPGSPPDSDQINTNLKNELNAEVICFITILRIFRFIFEPKILYNFY